MKEIILIVCLAAIASAIPRPDHLQMGNPALIPKEFRREAIPEGILAPQAQDDAIAPNTIAINFVHIAPQQALQDFIELVKVAQHALQQARPEEIKIVPFPFHQANVEPVQIENVMPAFENQLPSDNFVADKVVVVNNEIPEADKVQVVNSLPKEENVGEESITNEVEKIKIVDIPEQEQNDVIRVASIPIQIPENDRSPDVDQFWGVKFVESPNVDGDSKFIGVPAPIAPSELDSLRVDFNENPSRISLSNAKEPKPFYPINLYSDPMLR